VLFVQGAGARSGAESALLARVRHLPEHGVDPVVAFLADGPFRREVEGAGVETVLLGEGPRLRSVTRVPSAVRGLAAAVRAQRADLLEGCGEKMSVLAGWAARLAGCGCVFNLQDAPRRSPTATAVQLVAAGGRHDAVVVPSEWMARGFRGFGLRPRVVPNGISPEDVPREPADVRALAAWPSESVLIGHFGRLVPWKGPDVLLRAARRLHADAARTRFLFAGGTFYGRQPGYEEGLHELTDRLGLGDVVHFAGYREDALSLMAGCDAVAHCSLEPEPFGMVVLEAMALGKPVVASRMGGPEEIVDHGRTGILVDPGDEGRLSAELASLVADPARRAGLGEAARLEVERRYSGSVVCASLGALYRDVASRRSRRQVPL